MSEIARIEIIVHSPALNVDAAMPAAQSSEELDLCRHALQQEQARNHQLVETMREQGELLRSRTIERDHFKEDSHLWGLALAYLVSQESDEQLLLPVEPVTAMEGMMLSGKVEEGYVHLTLAERPDRSAEAG